MRPARRIIINDVKVMINKYSHLGHFSYNSTSRKSSISTAIGLRKNRNLFSSLTRLISKNTPDKNIKRTKPFSTIILISGKIGDIDAVNPATPTINRSCTNITRGSAIHVIDGFIPEIKRNKINSPKTRMNLIVFVNTTTIGKIYFGTYTCCIRPALELIT
jgi:hypothetical protein